MHLFDLTLGTPEENLALDEALLNEAEASAEPREALRLWESPEPLVVIGRGSQAALEVDLSGCQARGIPVLRRTSGGAAIVAGRGCLMYAVVLSYELRPHLRALDLAHRFVLDTTLGALRPLVEGVRCQGTSDLTLGDAKVSGNSVRCKRRNFLYHGTLLYDFHLPLVEACLRMPPRRPAYRHDRAHQAFLANLPASGSALREALVGVWQAESAEREWPRQRVVELVASRYGRSDWNFQR